MKPYRLSLAALLAALSLSNAPFRASAQIAYQAWLQRYEPVGGPCEASAIVVDQDGNVLVTGDFWNGTNSDYATLKYSNAGTPLWTNRYDGPGNLSDVPAAIAVDQSGNVFVTGSSFVPTDNSTVPATGYRYATVAYSGNAVPLWTNTYAGGGYAAAVAVAVDQNGNVFVTGAAIEVTNGPANMTTIAYSGGGAPLWTNRYKGAGAGGASHASGIALDKKGNVFVAGYSYGADGYQHYAAVAYSNAGVPLWTNQYIGPVNIDDGRRQWQWTALETSS
jgi:hypothetical protein